MRGSPYRKGLLTFNSTNNIWKNPEMWFGTSVYLTLTEDDYKDSLDFQHKAIFL